MALTPSGNDRRFNLIFKTAWNWYEHAVGIGLSGFNPPSLNDKEFDLLKKTAYFTARIADS